MQLARLGTAREDPKRFSEAAYIACRNFLVEHLQEAILAQEDDRFLDIGDGYDEYDQSLPRDGGPEFGKLHAALRFWDARADAAEHEWHYYDLLPEEWMALAREIAARVERDEDPPERIIRAF